MVYILREIWHVDKLMIIACFGFALFMYGANLCAVFTDKYVVELAAAGFGNTRLLVMTIALIVGHIVCFVISKIATNYQGFCDYCLCESALLLFILSSVSIYTVIRIKTLEIKRK